MLVPAHDEAVLVGRCVASLRQQSYPADLYEIVVIADNCTDDTAARAAAAGATVLVRTAPDARGKGPALRWAMDRMLESDPDLAALAVVDADSVADPGLLGALVARLEQGAPVVQAEYLGRDEDGSIRSELRAAAFLLFHRVRFGGRAVLGLPCHLVGNGMLFSREVLADHPWDAFTSAEDLEYSVDLRLAGVRPVYAGDARLGRTRGRAWAGGAGTATPVGGRTLPCGPDPSAAAVGGGDRPSTLVPARRRRRPGGAPARPAGGGLAARGVARRPPPRGRGRLLVGGGPWLVAVAAVPTFVVVGLAAGRAPAPCGGRSRWPPPWWWPRSGPVSGF